MKYHGKGMLLQYRRIKTKSERVIPSSCFKAYVYLYTLKMGGWTVNFTLDTVRKKYSHFLELPLVINIKKKLVAGEVESMVLNSL